MFAPILGISNRRKNRQDETTRAYLDNEKENKHMYVRNLNRKMEVWTRKYYSYKSICRPNVQKPLLSLCKTSKSCIFVIINV